MFFTECLGIFSGGFLKKGAEVGRMLKAQHAGYLRDAPGFLPKHDFCLCNDPLAYVCRCGHSRNLLHRAVQRIGMDIQAPCKILG